MYSHGSHVPASLGSTRLDTPLPWWTPAPTWSAVPVWVSVAGERRGTVPSGLSLN